MPSAPKNSGTEVPAGAAELPFEEALKKLESIVEAMEAEDLPLEKLLANFQEGTRLARVCQERIAEAEVKVQQLERAPGGELILKPARLENTSAQPVEENADLGSAPPTNR